MSSTRHITYVKKRLADGSLCNKCADVQQRLEQADQMRFINEVLIADEQDEQSAGMQLAAQHDVARAPFFVVSEDGSTRIYESYLRFVKAELGSAVSSKDENRELLEQNPELDLI